MLIDQANNVSIGLDIYSVPKTHQEDLVNSLIEEQFELWKNVPEFISAALHRSNDGVRVFCYSQWNQGYDHRDINSPDALYEFFPPDSAQLEITASHSTKDKIEIVKGGPITHLAEFRLMPKNSMEMLKRTTSALPEAFDFSPGLISATFHTSLDRSRMFNYGQWKDQKAIGNLLEKPGFGKDTPYWHGLARNEFHLYEVVHIIGH